MTPIRKTLLSLPVEMLFLIRSFISVEDIQSHFALQSTCGATRALYLSDEPFWAAFCFKWGIGRPADEYWPHHPLRDATWRDIAITVTNHLFTCPFPDCEGWDGFSELECALSPPISHPEITMIGCRGFHIALRLDTERGSRMDSHTLMNCYKSKDDWLDPYDKHVAGSCVFATDPPLNRIEISVLNFVTVDVCNPGGVTVYDVVCVLAEELCEWDDSFSLAEFADLYRTHRRTIDTLQQFDWLRETTFLGVCMCMLMFWLQGKVPPSAWNQFMNVMQQVPRPEYNAPLLTVLDRFDDVTVEDVVEYLYEVPVLRTNESMDSLWPLRSFSTIFHGAWFQGLTEIGMRGSGRFKTDWSF